jgi:small subunit ribosomal protein S15e
MADDAEAIHAAELKKKRQFRKYAYRGVDLADLLDKSSEEVNITNFTFKYDIDNFS